jgi:hypothetical protein
MADTKFEAKRKADEIIIRLPLSAILAAIAKENAGAPEMIDVVNTDYLLDELVDQINDTEIFAEHVVAEVDALIEIGSASVKVKASDRNRSKFISR